MQRFTERKKTARYSHHIEENEAWEEIVNHPIADRPTVKIGDSIDISLHMRYAEPAATKYVRRLAEYGTLTPDEIEQRRDEYKAEMAELIRGLDIRKLRLIDDFFLHNGNILNHIEANIFEADDPIFGRIDSITGMATEHDLAEVLRTIAALPAERLLTPELNRYYYEEKTEAKDRDARDAAAIANAERSRLLLADLGSEPGSIGARVSALINEHREENERLRLLEQAEETIAKKLFAAEQNTRNAYNRSAFTKWRLERRERAVAKSFIAAQKKTEKYIEKLKKKNDRKLKNGEITEFAYNSRLDQLEKRDFTYTVMANEILGDAAGQLTYSESLEGVEKATYAELSVEERVEEIGNIAIRLQEEFIERLDAVIAFESENPTMTKNQLATFISNMKKELVSINAQKEASQSFAERTTRAAAAKWSDTANRTIPNPEVTLAYEAAFEAEATDMRRIGEFRRQIAEKEEELFEYSIIKRLGREGEFYKPEEVTANEAKQTELDSVKVSYDSYKSGLIHAYNSYLQTGERSPEYVREKLLSINSELYGGFVGSRIDPIGDIAAFERAVELRRTAETAERERFTAEIMSRTRGQSVEREQQAEEPMPETELDREMEDGEPEDEVDDGREYGSDLDEFAL